MSDIRAKWKNVVRRLQSEASKNNGYAVLRVSIIIDSNGDPVTWFSPEMSLFEPRSLDLEALKKDMGEEFGEILEILQLTK